METLERAIYNSVIGRTKKITRDEIFDYVQEDGDMFVSALFRVVHTIIEDYPKSKKLYNLDSCFEYIVSAAELSETIDPSSISKKIKKVDKKIDLIIDKKLNKRKKLIDELRAVKRKLSKAQDKVTDESTHRYDFIDYLIREPRNIDFIEFTFKKIPVVMQAKDKAGITLFRNLTRSYMESIEEDNTKDMSYYKSLIWLMLSQENFKLSDEEKKEILQDIYKVLEKMSHDKLAKKTNREKIKYLQSLKELIAPKKEKDFSMQEVASKYEIPIGFPLEVTQLVDNYKKPITLDNYPDRKIFNGYVLSIDGPTTVEIDDALSCQKMANGHYFLGVHVASVLGYYDYESPIVENAFNRVKSIYIRANGLKGQGMIPIFPERFSTDIGALVEGRNRLARSYFFEVDQEGNVVNQRFMKTIIKNTKRATYQEINKILESGTPSRELQRTVDNLQEVSEILSKKHHIDRLYELVKEKTPDPSELKVKKTGSEDIVYQCMLLTGNKVAEFFASHNYPCLYRTHHVDDELNSNLSDRVKDMIEKHGETEFEKIQDLLNGLYPKGIYNISGNHQGLGFNNYCHCTSGLRRAADIVVEHALEVCHDKTPTEEDLENLALDIRKKQEIINSKSDPIDWFVEDFQRGYQKAKSVKQKGR